MALPTNNQLLKNQINEFLDVNGMVYQKIQNGLNYHKNVCRHPYDVMTKLIDNMPPSVFEENLEPILDVVKNTMFIAPENMGVAFKKMTYLLINIDTKEMEKHKLDSSVDVKWLEKQKNIFNNKI
ncbi:MAG: hypothetical protein Edafosvirus12_2 [Edafosvirus sp.]|uniref:Uncharacterized protein n=1 Tax=Edafosvirus sp. TaxID=2487765 RepID=A0A3G4ZXT3_9VIRU|nr:MAG: hypothetical protein Edafosvirus12_2 [Edafosvirus sp.]